MVEQGTSKELELIVKKVASEFVRFRPCTNLGLNISYGGKMRVFTKEIMICTTNKKLISYWCKYYPQINSNCFLKARYKRFKNIDVSLDDAESIMRLKFGIIDRNDEWIWYVGRWISMEARLDPLKEEYALSLKDVFKNIFKALVLGMEGVRTPVSSSILLDDGIYVDIHGLNENDKHFLIKRVLPFLADLSKSRLKWLSYV